LLAYNGVVSLVTGFILSVEKARALPTKLKMGQGEKETARMNIIPEMVLEMMSVGKAIDRGQLNTYKSDEISIR